MLKLFIICPGLGQVRRGYESFAEEIFQVLSKQPSLDITLFKGGGEAKEKEIPLWNLYREGRVARKLSNYIKRKSYFVEQISFCFSLLPYINRYQPDLIYFSDNDISYFLWHWRRLTKQRYKILFSNGSPLRLPHPTFYHCDRIHQVAPVHLNNALKAGIPADKQSLVPLGTHISAKLEILSGEEKEALKAQLGLPTKQPLILSVGFINKGHKRMDYVIREVANLPNPRPYLLLLGQQEGGSIDIPEMGNSLLGKENFQIRTVPQNEVANYYKVADAFALGSLNEGFGRVFLEAMSHGLPCLVHDYEVTRFVFEDQGYYGDFKVPGSLTNLIKKVLAEQDLDRYIQRHHFAYERFSWDKLTPAYLEMIEKCLK